MGKTYSMSSNVMYCNTAAEFIYTFMIPVGLVSVITKSECESLLLSW